MTPPEPTAEARAAAQEPAKALTQTIHGTHWREVHESVVHVIALALDAFRRAAEEGVETPGELAARLLSDARREGAREERYGWLKVSKADARHPDSCDCAECGYGL